MYDIYSKYVGCIEREDFYLIQLLSNYIVFVNDLCELQWNEALLTHRSNLIVQWLN